MDELHIEGVRSAVAPDLGELLGEGRHHAAADRQLRARGHGAQSRRRGHRGHGPQHRSAHARASQVGSKRGHGV